MVACPGFLSPGRWRQVDTWNSLAGQPRLLVEFLVSGTPCLKDKQTQNKTNKKTNGTRNHPSLPSGPHMCVYIHTQHQQYLLVTSVYDPVRCAPLTAAGWAPLGFCGCPAFLSMHIRQSFRKDAL